MEEILFFATPEDFREWLAQNHDQQPEQWVGYYKKASKKPSMTWSESVDQALCYGWIDGLRKSIDEESYRIRFTPRRPNSIWSAVNLKKMKELISNGLMKKPGLEIFEKRKPEKAEIYAYERKNAALPEEYIDLFKNNEKAWEFFQKAAPYYQKHITWWVISAKKKETQLKRLHKLIAHSEEGKKVQA